MTERSGWRRFLGRADEPTNGSVPLAALAVQLERIERRLDELAGNVASLENHPASLPPALSVAQPNDDLVAALAALEKQISRAGREQFKANTLAETQLRQLDAALEHLRTADALRESEVQELQGQQSAAVTAARLDVARTLLPALDSIDEALRAGAQVLAQPVPEPPTTRRGFFRRAVPPPPPDPLRPALASWLQGLTFVRQRLLDVLRAENITPIPAQGEAFDPHLHVALDVVRATDDTASGTVVGEIRRGYRVGDRILRHAEVVVTGVVRNS